jgi:hypothetical protein
MSANPPGMFRNPPGLATFVKIARFVTHTYRLHSPVTIACWTGEQGAGHQEIANPHGRTNVVLCGLRLSRENS